MKKIFLLFIFSLLLFSSPVSASETGSAAFYSHSYDFGGWQSIIQKRISWGEYDGNAFPYDPDGFYCVKIGYSFGSILTLTNARTGKTATCTVADNVAPQDYSYWNDNFVVEISYPMFQYLDLGNGNRVTVKG